MKNFIFNLLCITPLFMMSSTLKAQETLVYTDPNTQWEKIWGEEFSIQGEPSSDKWVRCRRLTSTWNKNLSDSPDVCFINEDGYLVLRAIPNPNKETDTAVMLTGGIESRNKFSLKYGRIECRIKLKKKKGNFPAFWMMPQSPIESWPACGEIDIMEQIDTRDVIYHTAHSYWTYTLNHNSEPQHGGTTSINVDDWHVYSFQWDSETLQWAVDGKKSFSYANMHHINETEDKQWPFDQEFYLILNQSVGNGGWASVPDYQGTYEMLVDWVRVYKPIEKSEITETYATNNDKNATIFRTDRALNAISFKGDQSSNSYIPIIKDKQKVYHSYLDKSEKFKLGEKITPTFNYKGNWMHGYLYLDKNQDGQFKVLIDEDYKPNKDGDLISYSYYDGHNSLGTDLNENLNPGITPPAFNLSTITKPGIYRMRAKIDWDNTDPGGSTVFGNGMIGNGGYIVDFLANIHGEKVGITTNLSEEVATIPDSITFGKELTLMLPLKTNSEIDTIIVKHGYNLSDDSIQCDNKQWTINMLPQSAINKNEITIPASIIDGDLFIKVIYKNIVDDIYNISTENAPNIKILEHGIQITTDHYTLINIINICGQIVYLKNQNGSNMIILPTGIYFVNDKKIFVK